MTSSIGIKFNRSLFKSPAGQRCSEAETEAYTCMATTLKRSYEGSYWYYVTFKPFNKAYDNDPDYFAYKGLSKCRDLFKKPDALLLTRETQAAKIHINALVCTKQDLMKRHEKTYCNKYKLHIQKLADMGDRHNVLRYITKEEQDRPFKKYLDYIHFERC